MAKINGMFCKQLIGLMSLYDSAKKEADLLFEKKCGIKSNNINPDDFYDIEAINIFINAYIKASPSGENALITLGKQFMIIMKQKNLLPPTLKTLKDFIKFENEMYLQVHAGPDVKPRKIIKDDARMLVLDAPSCGYNSKVFLGVYQGIVDACKLPNGKVEQLNSGSEIKITWN